MFFAIFLRLSSSTYNRGRLVFEILRYLIVILYIIRKVHISLLYMLIYISIWLNIIIINRILQVQVGVVIRLQINLVLVYTIRRDRLVV